MRRSRRTGFQIGKRFYQIALRLRSSKSTRCSAQDEGLSNSRRSFVVPRFVSFGDGGAFVVGFFAFGDGDLDLGAPVFEVDACRHNCHTFDADVVPQFADLFFVQEQASFAFWFMVKVSPCLFIGRDVRFDKPGFFFIWNIHIRFLDADLPGADGFDLRSLQDEASLEFFHEEVFEAGFAIGCDYFDVFCHGLILA